jgi:radical SAM protein with 4Fe4S-binding SPASM domain
LVFGTNKEPGFDIAQMAATPMPMENIIKILDEVKDAKPALNPSYWVEPLVSKNFRRVVVEATDRGIPVAINTNGLLITEKMAQFLVDHLSAVSVSIDAITPETLEKTRSTTRLNAVERAVHRLIEKRGSAQSPRIVVSFTEEDVNRHEREEFLQKWIGIVDAVKVNGMYTYERVLDNITITRDRTPCREIYDQMNIDFNGEVRMCCLDGFRKTNMGNVFKDGVYNVWHGPAFTELRKHHEEDNYDDEPFCKDCTLWANYNITDERQEGNLLIRSSDGITFYNNIDKMGNWKSELKRNDLEFLPGGG